MWPPGILLDRKCNKDFTLPPPSDESDQTYEVHLLYILRFILMFFFFIN